MKRSLRPKWWMLFLTVPLMLGLLVVEGHLPIPPAAHQIAEPAIVLAGFGLMGLWVSANQGAMMDEAAARERWVFTEVPDPAARPELAEVVRAWPATHAARVAVPPTPGPNDLASLPLADALGDSQDDGRRPDSGSDKGCKDV